VTASWEHDWPEAIRALEALQNLQAACDNGETPEEQLYTAHYAYGALLEQRNRLESAIEAYETALLYNPLGTEATDALRRLNVYTPAPPAPCDAVEVTEALAAVPYYTPTSGAFIRIEGSQFVVEDEQFPVYGVNYYPRDTPWKRFLTDTDITTVKTELDLLHQVGLNTLRISHGSTPSFRRRRPAAYG
jgi:tetratricopeptide (TPR) repeat protein